MALTDAQHAARAGKVGASFAPALMTGDRSRILEEWFRLVEHPDYAPPDLSQVWPVQLGSYLEPFALDWREMITGMPLTRRGEWVPHPDLPWLGCTLDAYRADDASVIDVKAPGAHRRLDEVLDHYTPQMVVQRACTGARRAALLIVHGGAEPHEYEISWSAEYEAEVWCRLHWFWEHVESLQPPVPLPANAIPPEPVRIADMSESNAWAYHAETWLGCRGPARAYEIAAKGIKELVAADVKQAHGRGLIVSRNRAGHLQIKEGRL